MVTKTVYREVAVDVNLDLDDFSDDELTEALEDRGFFISDQEDSGSISEAARDEIYELYRDYINGTDFDRKLKEFFEGQLGLIVH